MSADTKNTEAKTADEKRRIAKTREGIVVSNKMQKTVVVQTTRLRKDPTYGKYVRRSRKFYAHDEKGCQIGDQVRIEETRPISRLKRWKVTEIMRRAD